MQSVCVGNTWAGWAKHGNLECANRVLRSKKVQQLDPQLINDGLALYQEQLSDVSDGE